MNPSSIKPGPSSILAVNGGSSSIKVAVFELAEPLRRVLDCRIEGIGHPESRFVVKSVHPREDVDRVVEARDHIAALHILMDWLQDRIRGGTFKGMGHRLVLGGENYEHPQLVSWDMIEELRRLGPLDPEHLPEEILLIEAFHRQFPEIAQVACFDSAFHHDMPRVARQLAIPRRFESKGVRRHGFHGLSCAYLMEELERVAGREASLGRVVIAHLGNGASITAVRGGRSIDTTMGLTPASGIPMSCRSGDLDPGLARLLARNEHMTSAQFHDMVNHESGLLGISETTGDMQELLALEIDDERAAEAVALFCYQARKSICALAGALGGIDTLIFSGGIGEHLPVIRARICAELAFLGIELDVSRNDADVVLVSSPRSAVAVRVLPTDEEWMIARTVLDVLGLASEPYTLGVSE